MGALFLKDGQVYNNLANEGGGRGISKIYTYIYICIKRRLYKTYILINSFFSPPSPPSLL